MTLFDYGLVVASDALAQMLLSPVFGWLIDRWGRRKEIAMSV